MDVASYFFTPFIVRCLHVLELELASFNLDLERSCRATIPVVAVAWKLLSAMKRSRRAMMRAATVAAARINNLSTCQRNHNHYIYYSLRSNTSGKEVVGGACAAGYQSIGSFHSPNLAELMDQSDDDYQAPPLPFEAESPRLDTPIIPPSSESPQPPASFRDDFMIDFNTWTFLNHGAFGAATKVGHDRAAAWRRYADQQPLRYFDRDLLPHLAHSARCLARILSVPAAAAPSCTSNYTNRLSNTVALLPNVTAGMNAILAGHARVHGPKRAHCVLWDTTYGSVKKMAQYYYGPDNVTEIPFLQPRYLNSLASTAPGISPDHVFLQALDDCLVQHSLHLQDKHVCFVLDHVTSNTALTMPLAPLAKHIKERLSNVLVVVDGAHGLLAHDVDLTRLFGPLERDTASVGGGGGIDVYVTNAHKWFAAPRGVAFMAVNPRLSMKHINTLFERPAVISHGIDADDLFSRFVWDGCRDYTAALAVPAVWDYWNQIDHSTMRQNCKNTLRDGIQIMADLWHGGGACIDVDTWPGLITLMHFESLSPMALVRLPQQLTQMFGQINDRQQGFNMTSTEAKMVQDYLYHQKIEVPVKCVSGTLYVRMSCHVYNTLDDFRHLATTIHALS
jgi:selenocysteine lyase/cysteine desulfurase